MANSNDIQSTMSTKIQVDTQQAGEEVANLTNKFKDLTSSWKAEEAMAKASGDAIGAAKARYQGLSETLEVQKQKVEQLKRERQDMQQTIRESATVTKEQTDDLNKLDRQLASASNKLNSLSNQQERAKRSFEYASSGLKELKNEYYNNSRAIDSNVEKLRAEGQTAEAQKAKLSGLRISLENLTKQQKAAKELADSVARDEGKNSTAYQRRITDYNKISAAIAKTKTEAEQLSKSLNPPRTTAWDAFKTKILDVNGAEERAAKTGQRFKSVFSGAFLGTLTANILPAMQNQLHQITTTGMQAAQAGMAMEARWKNVGVSASGIKELQTQVGQLKTNTNLSAQAVNQLQSRFYGMTHSVSMTRQLTQGVGSLSDQLKLSDKQANGFASGLSRIEGSSKVTSSSLGRLEKQAPGLMTALSKASGMSQDAFQKLVASGKMTTQQFNQYLVEASKNYDNNSKSFSASANGSMHKLQMEWATTQAALAKPLVKVEATGLNQLSAALENKDTQRGLQQLATGMATLAVNAAKFIGFLAKHQTTVKVFGTTILGLAAAFKTMQGTVMAVDVVKHFAKLKGTAKIIELVTRNVKTLGTAVKIATLGFNPWVIAIEAVAAGFTLLYKHSKTFRSFVNNIGGQAKRLAKHFVNMGRSILKGAANLHKKLSRGWNNYWKEQTRKQRAQQKQEARYQAQRRKQDQRAWNTMKRNAARGWKSMERSASNGVKRIGRWYTNMGRITGRAVQNMAKQHPRIFGNMYKVIQDRTKTWHDLVTGHWSRLRDDTGRLAKDQSRANKDIFEDMYSAINKKTGGWLGKVVDSWKDHMSQIGDAISASKRKASQAMADLANGVLKPFKILIDDIQGGINWILDKVGASKLGGSWSAAIPTFATGTAGNPDGLKKSTIGMVNDGAGSHWREMYSYKGHVGMFPNKRNFITFLPKGMSILNGEDSHKLMNMMGLPHFANGIGDFFSGILSKSEDILENVDKILEHPIEFAKSVFDKFTSHIHTNIKFAASLVKNVPSYVAKQIGNWIKKQFATLENPGGAGVARWRPYIIRAFKQLGVEPAEWKVAKLLRQIQTESGGDPQRWQEIHDVNSGGNEARGLLQFAGSTWAADALPGHTDWRNGYNEILAAINVLEHGGEGGWGNVGNGHGWANGGLISTHGMYEVGEGNRPEMIIPLSSSKRSRAYQLLSEVMAQFKHEDGASQSNPNDQPYSKEDFINAQSQITELKNGIKELIELQKVQIAAIKAQGKFDPRQQNIQQAQALSMKLLQY